MRRSDIHPLPDYFGRYMVQAPDTELIQAFENSLQEIDRLSKIISEENASIVSEPGKWSIKEIIQHLSDCERIMAYRTLLFARKDTTSPASFDPDLLAANSKANKRAIEFLLQELRIVRLSTMEMFKSFDDETLQNTGINWHDRMSVLAMGFTILGHQVHHFNIIQSKYINYSNT